MFPRTLSIHVPLKLARIVFTRVAMNWSFARRALAIFISFVVRVVADTAFVFCGICTSCGSIDVNISLSVSIMYRLFAVCCELFVSRLEQRTPLQTQFSALSENYVNYLNSFNLTPS